MAESTLRTVLPVGEPSEDRTGPAIIEGNLSEQITRTRTEMRVLGAQLAAKGRWLGKLEAARAALQVSVEGE
jgi:hypothetical protein